MSQNLTDAVIASAQAPEPDYEQLYFSLRATAKELRIMQRQQGTVRLLNEKQQEMARNLTNALDAMVGLI